MARPGGTVSAILSIVGTAVGSFFGPAGAFIGSQLGTIVGNIIDPNALEGPRLDDLKVRASSYGRPIPLVYGRENRIGGNVIWSSGLIEQRHSEGSSTLGTKVVTYTYRADFAVALGRGIMRNISEVYANGKLLWSRQATLDALLALKVQDDANEQFAIANGYAYTPDPYLQSYDPDAQMPDFTPWVLAPDVSVAASPAGSGAFGPLLATMLRNADFERLEWFPGTDTQPVSPAIEEFQGATPAYRDTAYIVFKGLQLQKFSNAIPQIEIVLSGTRPETVAQVLDDICQRAGADLFEAVPRGALSQFFIRGYAIANATTASAAVVPLVSAFPFDACDHAGAIRFTPRRRGPYATITQEEMGARKAGDSYAAPFPLTREPDVDMPSEASVTHADPANAYEPNTQVALRAGGHADTKLHTSLPITFTADEARAIAERALWEAWLSRENAKLRLSLRYDFMQAGDLFAVPMPGTYTLYRILSVDRGDDGVIELTAAREDRLAYDGNAPGGAAFLPQQTISFIAGTDHLELNAPAITSVEDNSGYLYALDGSVAGWRGASLFRSTDDGGTYTSVGSSSDRAITGSVIGTLGSGSTELWDRLTTLTVDLFYPQATLSSLPEDTLLASLSNLIWIGRVDGSRGELLQFATATQISDGSPSSPQRYQLTNLLRGRRGTEHEVSAHVSDEVCVVIPAESVSSLDFGQSDWNFERLFKAASLHQRPEDVVIFRRFIATGERLRPRSPVHGYGVRNSAHDVTLRWTRRNRLFPPSLGRGLVPLGEASESYEVEVMSGSTVLRTASMTTPEYEYLASTQAIDGLTPGNAVTFRVYQISAVRGRGHHATFIV